MTRSLIVRGDSARESARIDASRVRGASHSHLSSDLCSDTAIAKTPAKSLGLFRGS